MKANMNRRDFLKGTAWMGAAAMAAGCQMNRFGFGQGGQMQDYAFQKLKGKNVRVGFIGVGQRGTAAVHRVSMIPGVEIVALCDKNPAAVEQNLKWLADSKYRTVPKKYIGDEAYKELCDFGDCDVVYCATPWALHQPVALRGLLGGKIALVEVTSALTVDECNLSAQKSAQGDWLVERPRRRTVHDIALAEVAKLLVRLVADILLRDGLVLAVGKPLEVALDRGWVLVAECDNLDAGDHRYAMDGRSTALSHADEADADILALEFLECIVLHLSALAEAEAVHLAAGSHGRSAHPSSSLEEITTIHVCFHMATTFREE